MELPCCGRRPSGNHKGHKNGKVNNTGHISEAASPLAPGDKYPQQLSYQQPQQSTNRQSNRHNYYPHRIDQNSPEDYNTNSTVIMTGNGFFVASSPGLMKSKSGSLPDRYNSPRGFRDTFVSSMTPPVSANSATSSPHHNHQMQMMSNDRNDTNSPKESVKDGSGGSKKWTFGGLFKRKGKTTNGTTSLTQSPNPRVASASPISGGSMSMSLSSPSPAPSSTAAVNSGNVFSPHPQPGTNVGAITKSTSSKYVNTNSPTANKLKGKLSESDLSSEDSEQENEATWAQSSTQPSSFKQNFLTRRLSRRKEKAAAKKKAIEDANSSQNGFLKVPGPRSGQLNNGKRVGSSPDSLNNTNGNNMFGFGINGPWPSWEITKKVPQLQAPNNYSSSGSLSLSIEGSSKGSRIAAKEAVKARAVARRESFFRDTSSEGEDEDVSRSSIQGSHSSLSSRNRRRPYINGNGNGSVNGVPNYNTPPQQGQTFRPADFTRGSPSSPAKFDYQNNYQHPQQQSPSFNKKLIAPGSPRWEARVVYQQENLENQTPFVVKLPRENRNLNQPINPAHSGYTRTPERASEEQLQQVITAGLRVPISAQAQPSQYITEEVTYANLPSGANNINNNIRTRSVTPQNYQAYNNVNPSPPPPPPRRDFNRLSQNNPNFYRPVSCSYLDSYKGSFQQRTASPNLNGNPIRSYTPVNHSTREHYESQSPQLLNNGNHYNEHDQVDNSRHLANNNFLAPNPYMKHASLVRSPSEPPEIKVQYARESPVKRNAITPSPYNYNNSEGPVNMNARNSSPQRQLPVVTSKLGFPVRRLQEASKIPGAQSPVHMRASEFWRKKEAEVTGNPVQPNPNQKRYINRIRSADSSPLPIHRMRNSPMIQNSNESISSLSSFSAEAASPHMFSNNLRTSGNPSHKTNLRNNPVNTLGQNTGNNSGQTQNTGHNSRQNQNQNTGHNSGQTQNNGNNSGQTGDQNPGNNPGQNSGNNSGNNSGRNSGENPGRREKTPSQSACERLKVRVPSAPSISSESPHPIRSLVDLNNGKTPGRNLEDALNELEDMYKSLRLSDEDLLDRAERRDLPTAHQELRNAPLIPLPQSMQNTQAFRFEALGSVESLATGSSSGSGTNYSGGSIDIPNRVRAPPLRRSARPDTVTDDMARRRLDSKETKPLDPRNVVSQTGSYMGLSPAFSPPVSPCPPETLPLSFAMGREEPDLTLDDVTFRNYRKANSIKIIDPQPPFGIPLGPITAAPGSDYLHSKKSDRLRPLFKAVKNPDLINDDIAFRNLRKDLNSENNLSKDWTPRLFSPTRDTVFNYNNIGQDGLRNKKLRAIRSLSANVTNFIPFTDYSFNSTDIGKWNSFTDLHQRHSSSSSPASNLQSQKRRASTYLQPSWVEQIEKVQTSTETLTENRNSNNKFASTNISAFPEPEHWERKLPSKTVQLTPELYDPSKPRRPWTDIILESFEKEKEIEIERIAQEAAEAAANADVNASNGTNVNDSGNLKTSQQGSHPVNSLDFTEEEDDVFLDAREDPKSTSPEGRTKLPSTHSNASTPPVVSTIRATVIEPYGDAFTLLTGHKNRRGSWVEPRTSSGYLPSEIIKEEDRRRKSWSDFPKDGISSGVSEFSSPIKKLFTPLPPPRKIKQINLEAFNPSTSPQSICLTKPINEGNCFEENGTKNVQIPPKSPNRGEEELNELMDMLIREADTCGPTNVTSTHTKEQEEGKAERKVAGKCSSQERVKPSISTGTTQKDMLDGNSKSVPKPISKESSVDEPTVASKKMEKTLRDVTVVPDIVFVIRKPDFKPLQGDSNKKIDTTNTITTHITEKQSPTYTSKEVDKSTTTTLTSIPRGCSIDELIDSINESLPELEASCASHKSTDSSLSTTGSLPSAPSPVSGSPTTITFPVRSSQPENVDEVFAKELENKCQDGDQSKEEMEFAGSTHGDEGLHFRRTSEEKADEAELSIRQTITTPTTTTSSEGSILRSDANISTSRKSSTSSANTSTKNDTPKAGHSGNTDSGMMVKKSAEDECRKTNERNVQDYDNITGCKKESYPGNGYKGNLPFIRTSASRSRSQSLIGSVSTSPTAGSEYGEVKKEKDKSHKRKSHLNRAFTEELVPDNTSPFHLSPHIYNNTEPKSNELSSSDYNSAEPRSRKSSNTIYKVPPIPSILTSNTSPVRSTPSNSISSTTQMPPSPTMKPKSSSILNKVQTFESRKSSPVVKHDSFSDAEGVSFIKKLLHKESMAEKASSEIKQSSLIKQFAKEPTGFMLKKSPSAGSNSYWSKFSNSQPAFLKRFFEKPDKPGSTVSDEHEVKCRETDISTPLPGPPPEEEPVLGFSVAQKASFFMKLEHEQRFSRWRKNSLESSSPISIPPQRAVITPEPRPRSSRQLTQPVTTMEVQLAANTILGERHDNTMQTNILSQNYEAEMTNYENDADTRDIERTDMPSYTEYDESISQEPSSEPSKLSLKDRVHMFDQIIATGTKVPSAASTPHPMNQYSQGTNQSHTGFPVYHSSSTIIPSSSVPFDNPVNLYQTNQINPHTSFSCAQKYDSSLNVDSSFIRRRGSASDLELSSTPKYSPAVTPRNSKTKSMYVADNDVSEDGEVSSGGQEVAEIISRSYENSPVVRKKSWRTQKQEQTSFTKEIWRRCKVNDYWPASQDNSKKPERNYRLPINVVHQVKPIQPITEPDLPASSTSPPETSNLLQILTVLSSSNDELSESKPKSKSKVEASVGNSSTGSSVSIPENSNARIYTSQSHVNVPHPDDESFQMFFGSRTSAFSHSKSFASTISNPKPTENNSLSHFSQDVESQSVGMEMNGCQRQSDLLVMKKNIPIVRRKSIGKSKNPLKALAARMDFRNQWYTDVSGTNPLPEANKYEGEMF